VEKFPATKDAYAGPNYEEWLARALARFGEKDRALEILQHLLVTSYADPITTALLRVDPYWDNLRGDPRFEKLCQEAAK
jgi:ribosomal protein L15E